LTTIWQVSAFTFRRVLLTMIGAGPDAQVRMLAGVGSGLVEKGGEGGDDFEQQGADAGLLVGGAVGAELRDGAAVLGLAGKLADPGGHGRVNAGRAAWDANRG
jgi:hypothetical protein